MDQHSHGLVTGIDKLSPAVREIIQHLCASLCHTYGAGLQSCESRGDRTYAVRCPGC